MFNKESSAEETPYMIAETDQGDSTNLRRPLPRQQKKIEEEPSPEESSS
jgi:hypothetical protein